MATLAAGASTIQLRLSTGDAIAGTPAQLVALLSENNPVWNESGADVDFRWESDASTHQLFIDGGNSRVGISSGSLLPTDGLLHVQSATAGSVAANANGDELVLEASGDGGLSILTPNANSGVINFGAPAGNAQGIIQYSHVTDRMFFSTVGVERFRIGADGITINEIGADVDFRVESDDNVNKLFLNAGLDILSVSPGTAPTALASIGGTLSVNVTQVGTPASTTETTLMSFTLPGGCLTLDGQGIEIIAWGTTAVPSTSVTLRFKWGGTTILTEGPTLTGVASWAQRIRIYRTGASAQDMSPNLGLWNNAGSVKFFQTDTEDLSTDTLIEITGQNGASPAANDMICHGLVVKYLG